MSASEWDGVAAGIVVNAWKERMKLVCLFSLNALRMKSFSWLNCLWSYLFWVQWLWGEQEPADLLQSKSTSQNQSISVQSSAQWRSFSHHHPHHRHHHWSALMDSGMCQSSPLCNSSDLYICTTVWLYSDIQNCRNTEHWYHHLHVQIHCCSPQTHQELKQ